jgi:hypothetical protein
LPLCHFTTYEAVSACYGKQPWNSALPVSLLYRFGVLLPLRLRTCVPLDFRARLAELLKTHTSWSSNLSSCRRTGFVCSFFLEFFRIFLCSSSRMVKWSETAVCPYRFLWRVSCFQERRTDQQSCFNWWADSPSWRSRERLLLDFPGAVCIIPLCETTVEALRICCCCCLKEFTGCLSLFWESVCFRSWSNNHLALIGDGLSFRAQFFLVDSPVALRIITLWDYCWSSAGLLLSFGGVSRPVLIVPLRAHGCFRRRSNNYFVIILLLQLEADLSLSYQVLFVDSPVAVCIVTLWDYC